MRLGVVGLVLATTLIPCRTYGGPRHQWRQVPTTDNAISYTPVQVRGCKYGVDRRFAFNYLVLRRIATECHQQHYCFEKTPYPAQHENNVARPERFVRIEARHTSEQRQTDARDQRKEVAAARRCAKRKSQITHEGMRIAIWLIGVVSASWACRTMAGPQGKRLTRVLRQVTCHNLEVSSGLCVESRLVRVLATDRLEINQ